MDPLCLAITTLCSILKLLRLVASLRPAGSVQLFHLIEMVFLYASQLQGVGSEPRRISLKQVPSNLFGSVSNFQALLSMRLSKFSLTDFDLFKYLSRESQNYPVLVAVFPLAEVGTEPNFLDGS